MGKLYDFKNSASRAAKIAKAKVNEFFERQCANHIGKLHLERAGKLGQGEKPSWLSDKWFKVCSKLEWWTRPNV
jgi:hypothetical protein